MSDKIIEILSERQLYIATKQKGTFYLSPSAMNLDIDAGSTFDTLADVNADNYTYTTTAAEYFISSDNASDTNKHTFRS